MKKWKPILAGILSIIPGTYSLITVLMVAIKGGLASGLEFQSTIETIAIFGIILGTTAIVGGIFAIRRQVWGLALAGAICALWPPPTCILGILAIVFVALSKNEFLEFAAKSSQIYQQSVNYEQQVSSSYQQSPSYSQQQRMNWFQRHLNWTWVFSYLLVILGAVVFGFLVVADPNVSEDAMGGMAAIFGSILILIPSGWVIKQKGRSLWWILLSGFFSPLWLANKKR